MVGLKLRSPSTKMALVTAYNLNIGGTDVQISLPSEPSQYTPLSFTPQIRSPFLSPVSCFMAGVLPGRNILPNAAFPPAARLRAMRFRIPAQILLDAGIGGR
jgi:hypothetical protein